jgi:hypothetical protein
VLSYVKSISTTSVLSVDITNTVVREDPLMLKINDLYWLAGLLEGEGWFGVEQKRYPKVSLQMCDEDVVRQAKDLVSVGSIYFAPREAPRKNAWVWQVSGANAPALMMTLYPLMGERRKQAILTALHIWHSVGVAYHFKANHHQGTKRCTRCFAVKSVTEFYTDYRTNQPRGCCKACHS